MIPQKRNQLHTGLLYRLMIGWYLYPVYICVRTAWRHLATNRVLQDVVDWLACNVVVYVWWENLVNAHGV